MRTVPGHRLALISILALATAHCSDSETLTGAPWDSFTVRIVADRTQVVPEELNPLNPDEGVCCSLSEPTKRAQIYRVHADGSVLDCLTCNHSDSAFNTNYQPFYTPDGERIVFASSRDRAKDANPFLNSFGGEIYIMNSDGSDPQRLTFYEGIARVPRVSLDGKRIFWSQVTSDNRWHLVFADLVERNGQFGLGDTSEVRILGRPNDPLSDLAHQLSFIEWKYPSPIGDWWSFFSAFGSSMNVDTYAVSPGARLAHRLTSNPENEETGSWDPTGLGMAVQSGRDYYQVRQLAPLPLPTLIDFAFVAFGLLVGQQGGAVPWVYDLYYLDETGENGMTKLVDGEPERLFTVPKPWLNGGLTLPFDQFRHGLANPPGSRDVYRYGVVDFEGRSRAVHRVGNNPAFLERASLESFPVEIVPFDPNHVQPSFETTIPGKISGQLSVAINSRLDHQVMTGTIQIRFDQFRNGEKLDGDFTLDGELSVDYEIPKDITKLRLTLKGDIQFTDPEGVSFRLKHDWKVEELTIKGDIDFQRPANTERREIRFPLATLLGL
ncbi:MAG: PD40 domain-containing protein [Nitrospirae bacterium]|nr:PD40 domain-containing protein [Nitrospirota bacterium]